MGRPDHSCGEERLWILKRRRSISVGSHSRRKSGEGSSGSGSSSGGGGGGMSGSSKGRRRSPVPSRRSAEKSGESGSTPHLTRPRPGSSHGSQEEGMAQTSPEEMDLDASIPSSSVLSNGSSEFLLSSIGGSDEMDGATPDFQRTRAAIDHTQAKICRTKELIKNEQTTRDDNVNEYLKLAANADKQQLARLKSVFEKKNQKSAQTIAQLQRKLESYSKKLRDLETHGANVHRQPREVLRDVGQGLKNVGGNIRDGITGFSGTVMSKPREFAHLIKNKFGSADNISAMSRNGESGSEIEERTHHGSATLPHGSTLTTPQTGGGSSTAIKSEEGSECSSVTSESIPPGTATHPSSPRHHQIAVPVSVNLEPLFHELQDRREEIERIKEDFDSVKHQMQGDLTYLTQSLQEERFRCERLEEQVNDLTELHQTEIENLKQAMSDMEEKVQYQSEERLRDIHEMLEHCQTKISRMEHQQQQHQQYVTLEGIENSNARAVVVKLINVVLTVLQVVLLLVATATRIIMPFLKTRLRILTTAIFVVVVVFVLRQWPEVKDLGSHLLRHYRDALAGR